MLIFSPHFVLSRKNVMGLYIGFEIATVTTCRHWALYSHKHMGRNSETPTSWFFSTGWWATSLENHNFPKPSSSLFVSLILNRTLPQDNNHNPKKQLYVTFQHSQNYTKKQFWCYEVHQLCCKVSMLTS